MHSAAARTQDYLPALDGLRAVSILLVVASHLGLGEVVPGGFGVTLFFFISGYLITLQLAGSLARLGSIGLGRFYVRRALRLLPAACVFVVISGAGYIALGGHIAPAAWAAALLYGANYYDLIGGFRSTVPGVRHPFNILWSLAIEEHFYAVWPLALGPLWRRNAALFAVLALCGLVLAWRAWLYHAGLASAAGPAWQFHRLYMATDTRLDSLAWGAALALLQQRGRMPPRWAAWPGLALLAASFVGASPFAREVLRTSVQGVALLAAMPALLGGAGVAARLLSATPFVVIGRLSYSLYLWHWGALMLADAWFPSRFGAAWVVAAILLSSGFASASFFLVERPMLGLRRHFGSHAPRSWRGSDAAA